MFLKGRGTEVDMMMHEPRDTDEIRRRMEEVRCDLVQDVQEIVDDARDLRDWRYYVKTYPSVCLGTALAVGYLIVPRRMRVRADVQTLTELAKQSQSLATPKLPLISSARSMVLSLAGKMAMRSILSYIERRAGGLLEPQAVNPRPMSAPHA